MREIPKMFLWAGYILSACIIFLCKGQPIIVKLLKSDFSSLFFCNDPSHLRPSHYVFVYAWSFFAIVWSAHRSLSRNGWESWLRQCDDDDDNYDDYGSALLRLGKGYGSLSPSETECAAPRGRLAQEEDEVAVGGGAAQAEKKRV